MWLLLRLLSQLEGLILKKISFQTQKKNLASVKKYEAIESR